LDTTSTQASSLNANEMTHQQMQSEVIQLIPASGPMPPHDVWFIKAPLGSGDYAIVLSAQGLEANGTYLLEGVTRGEQCSNRGNCFGFRVCARHARRRSVLAYADERSNNHIRVGHPSLPSRDEYAERPTGRQRKPRIIFLVEDSSYPSCLFPAFNHDETIVLRGTFSL